jgi:hypothetical protein
LAAESGACCYPTESERLFDVQVILSARKSIATGRSARRQKTSARRHEWLCRLFQIENEWNEMKVCMVNAAARITIWGMRAMFKST